MVWTTVRTRSRTSASLRSISDSASNTYLAILLKTHSTEAHSASIKIATRALCTTTAWRNLNLDLCSGFSVSAPMQRSRRTPPTRGPKSRWRFQSHRPSIPHYPQGKGHTRRSPPRPSRHRGFDSHLDLTVLPPQRPPRQQHRFRSYQLALSDEWRFGAQSPTLFRNLENQASASLGVTSASR